MNEYFKNKKMKRGRQDREYKVPVGKINLFVVLYVYVCVCVCGQLSDIVLFKQDC